MPKRRTLLQPSRIAAICELDELEGLVEAFAHESGYDPELLSHWDPKPDFQREIESWLPDQGAAPSRVMYAYSSYLDLNDPALMGRLHEGCGRGLVVTGSGTASIATVLTFLKHAGVDSIDIVAPAYFAIEALCEALGICVSLSAIERIDQGYRLPAVGCERRTQAVWLTLPIFGTSCYVAPDGVAKFIDSIPGEAIVVVDESLAYSDRPGLSETRTLDRVVRIATPNKAICVNGEKASFVTAPQKFVDALNDWSECLAGGIGASGLAALKFFQSEAFDRATAMSRQLHARQKTRMLGVLTGLSAYSFDEDTDGHFVTLYWPRLAMSHFDQKDQFIQMMERTGAAIIPSSRNRHPAKYGLSFRVNLCRLDNAGLGALRRLAVYLEGAA